MATKKIDIPMVTIGDRCIICGEVFAKKHPKDNRCICEKCCDKIAKIIEVGIVPQTHKNGCESR